MYGNGWNWNTFSFPFGVILAYFQELLLLVSGSLGEKNHHHITPHLALAHEALGGGWIFSTQHSAKQALKTNKVVNHEAVNLTQKLPGSPTGHPFFFIRPVGGNEFHQLFFNSVRVYHHPKGVSFTIFYMASNDFQGSIIKVPISKPERVITLPYN